MYGAVWQGCTNPGRQVGVMTEYFFMVAPNICESLV